MPGTSAVSPSAIFLSEIRNHLTGSARGKSQFGRNSELKEQERIFEPIVLCRIVNDPIAFIMRRTLGSLARQELKHMYRSRHKKPENEQPARFQTTKVRNLKISIFIVVALWILAGLKLAGSFISL